MSHVHDQEMPHAWLRSLKDAPVVLIARRAGETELYKQRIFPRETIWRPFDYAPEEGTALLDHEAARQILGPLFSPTER